MNREEILEKSRQENHGQDVANLEVSRSSMVFGWVVTVCLLAVVAVTEAIKYDRMNSGIFFAVMAGLSVIFIRKYLKGMCKKIIASTIDCLLCNDVSATCCQSLNRICDRCSCVSHFLDTSACEIMRWQHG